MGLRHRNALMIDNPGACNPSGIMHDMLAACREIRETIGGDVRTDPAIKLMAHQLMHSVEISPNVSIEEYAEWKQSCITALSEEDRKYLQELRVI